MAITVFPSMVSGISTIVFLPIYFVIVTSKSIIIYSKSLSANSPCYSIYPSAKHCSENLKAIRKIAKQKINILNFLFLKFNSILSPFLERKT